LAAKLDALSPLLVLARGYSLTQRLPDGRLIRDASELQVGDQIATRFAAGRAISRIEEVSGVPVSGDDKTCDRMRAAIGSTDLIP
ncbi:MAG: hypothetical protein HY000_24350, partial [Planctomycetes bacterium]|nr:hypothetical protein [Planctomycetota bacterium]